jgi:hypothetical protein
MLYMPPWGEYPTFPMSADGLSEEDLLICHYEVPGYSLASKTWGAFHIDHIQEIDYNIDAFSNLVFAEDKKRLIRSLVQQRSSQDEGFDDHIKGKGKGLIFLLHGPPGVGKTFTAGQSRPIMIAKLGANRDTESIADDTRRPLLTVSSGQIIGPAHVVEKRLGNLLTMATKWDALVLVDEADVFMQERAMEHLERNALVSSKQQKSPPHIALTTCQD